VILFLDTSSLVKLYVEEAGSASVRRLVADASRIAVSVLAYPEARSAFARRRREGALTASGLRAARAAFEQDWTRMVRLAVTEDVYRAAGSLAERHGLRALDGLQLASFLSLRRRLPARKATFSTFDRRLERVAPRARWPGMSTRQGRRARPAGKEVQ
jgi:predicted nucleic acid-binding protein